MFCNHCGVENPGSARVCRNCGRSFHRETNAMTSLCFHCRTPNSTDANYCQQCGQPLGREAGPDFFAPPPSSSPTPGVPAVQGTPQAGGVPMVQSTSPTPINPDAGAFPSSPKESASPHPHVQASNPHHALSSQPSHFSSLSQQATPSSISPQPAASQPSPFASVQQPPTPSGLSLKASTPEQVPSQVSSAPQKATALRHSFAGGSTAKAVMIVVAAVVVVAAGGLAAASRLLPHPQPLISITSTYKVGTTLAGASGTVLHISGQQFSSNSAITFLLDGHAAPGNAGTHSDANGNFSTDVTITNAWSVGTHTLTATDASNNSTKNSVSVTIVQPGQANIPGPNGAPPDDASFKLNVTVQTTYSDIADPFAINPVLIITGHPDPEGGTVCSPDDNGQSFTRNGTTSQGTPYTGAFTASCSGTYKAGQISYTETDTSVKYLYQSNGVNVTCVQNNPTVDLRLTGAYAGNDTFSGTINAPYVPYTCDQQGYSFYQIALQGTWTGKIVT